MKAMASRFLLALAAVVQADKITGTRKKDVLVGGGNSDNIRGLKGDDTIKGSGNEDYIYGGDGHDRLFGGDGSDYINGGDGNDVIFGGADDDVIYGRDGSDVIYGDDGNDDIRAHGSNDRIYGGRGDDEIYGGSGYDVIYGGPGDDELDGSYGNDIIHARDGEHDVIKGGLGNDIIWKDAHDEVRGSAGCDIINGVLSDESKLKPQCANFVVPSASDLANIYMESFPKLCEKTLDEQKCTGRQYCEWSAATGMCAYKSLPPTSSSSNNAFSDVLFLGDSDIEYWEDSKLGSGRTSKSFPGSTNKGRAGWTCGQVSNKLNDGMYDAALNGRTRAVLVCGENDMTDSSPEQAFNRFKTVVTRLRNKGITHVVYMGTKPEPDSKWLYNDYEAYDQLIRGYLSDVPELSMVDVYQGFEALNNPRSFYAQDRLHLSREGYGHWNSWAAQALSDATCREWRSGNCVSSGGPASGMSGMLSNVVGGGDVVVGGSGSDDVGSDFDGSLLDPYWLDFFRRAADDFSAADDTGDLGDLDLIERFEQAKLNNDVGSDVGSGSDDRGSGSDPFPSSRTPTRAPSGAPGVDVGSGNLDLDVGSGFGSDDRGSGSDAYPSTRPTSAPGMGSTMVIGSNVTPPGLDANGPSGAPGACATTCTCSYIGALTDMGVQFFCQEQARDVCHNLVQDWCAADEHVCERP